MGIMEIATLILIFTAYSAFAGKRLMTYMHVLQQEDYFNDRLFSWMRKNGAFDKRRIKRLTFDRRHGVVRHYCAICNARQGQADI